jgi:hypothetical protein
LIMNDNRVSAIVPYANYKYDFLLYGGLETWKWKK